LRGFCDTLYPISQTVDPSPGQNYVGSLRIDRTGKIDSHISPILPKTFTGVDKCDSWPRFSTQVFDVLWFRISSRAFSRDAPTIWKSLTYDIRVDDSFGRFRRSLRTHLKFNQSIFSERELMFMFAICRRPSVCLSSVCLSSVCRLSSVTFVHSTQAIEIFGNVSTPFGTLAICDLR